MLVFPREGVYDITDLYPNMKTPFSGWIQYVGRHLPSNFAYGVAFARKNVGHVCVTNNPIILEHEVMEILGRKKPQLKCHGASGETYISYLNAIMYLHSSMQDMIVFEDEVHKQICRMPKTLYNACTQANRAGLEIVAAVRETATYLVNIANARKLVVNRKG